MISNRFVLDSGKFILIALTISISACASRPQTFQAGDEMRMETSARLKECPKSHANKSGLHTLRASGASRAAIFREATNGLDARLACEYNNP